MRKIKMKQSVMNASLVLMTMVFMSSCMSTKKVPYFQNMGEVDFALSKHQNFNQSVFIDASRSGFCV